MGSGLRLGLGLGLGLRLGLVTVGVKQQAVPRTLQPFVLYDRVALDGVEGEVAREQGELAAGARQ